MEAKFGLLFSIVCVLAHATIGSCIASLQKQQYQEKLMTNFSRLRPGPHTYAGYRGPWLENRFFDYFVAKASCNATLERVYIPIMFTDAILAGMSAEISEALQMLDRQYKYFAVVQLDLGLGERHPDYKVRVPHDLDIVGFMAGGCSVCEHFRHLVPIPLLKKELAPSDPPPAVEYNVMFQGSMTHGLRKRFKEEYENIFTVLPPSKDWILAMEKSNFTLTPRGFGETSFRLFEAIQLGTIPIYIWQGDKWLPFEELVDWTEVAVVMSGQQMVNGGLKRKIDALQTRVPEMKRELQRVRHMFTYNFTVKYIVDTLFERFNS